MLKPPLIHIITWFHDNKRRILKQFKRYRLIGVCLETVRHDILIGKAGMAGASFVDRIRGGTIRIISSFL